LQYCKPGGNDRDRNSVVSRDRRERLGGIYSASPVAADGNIYLFGESGETVVLRAAQTPQVLAETNSP
jgi:hypothetical protein